MEIIGKLMVERMEVKVEDSVDGAFVTTFAKNGGWRVQSRSKGVWLLERRFTRTGHWLVDRIIEAMNSCNVEWTPTRGELWGFMGENPEAGLQLNQIAELTLSNQWTEWKAPGLLEEIKRQIDEGEIDADAEEPDYTSTEVVHNVREIWQQYLTYLMEKYPPEEGEEFKLTCEYHRMISNELFPSKVTTKEKELDGGYDGDQDVLDQRGGG